jgi:2-(1,2-epoxy-1,2-dihydrophenyl)acetyl-CoA isomerase
LNVLGEDGPALVAAGKALALLLRAAPQPVIAAVNGAAAGGGANLALACDYRIAADGAAIGQVFARLGLGPDWGGSYFLPRLVGPSRALELLWSARMVPAAEAHALGLFDRVVPAAQLLADARALALVWAGFPRLALQRAKEAIYRSERASLAEMLDAEITLQHELFATPDARERIGASLATRSR